jgi:MFS family permease
VSLSAKNGTSYHPVISADWYLGLYGTSAIMCLFCPLITYAFIAHTSIGWRGAYWYMCGFHAFGLVCMFFFYKPPTFETKHKEDGVSKWKLVAEMDYVGLFLFTAGCVLFLVGLSFGGRHYPWRHAAVITPIVVGFFLLVLLFVWVFNADLKYPFLPPKLFRQWRG